VIIPKEQSRSQTMFLLERSCCDDGLYQSDTVSGKCFFIYTVREPEPETVVAIKRSRRVVIMSNQRRRRERRSDCDLTISIWPGWAVSQEAFRGLAPLTAGIGNCHSIFIKSLNSKSSRCVGFCFLARTESSLWLGAINVLGFMISAAFAKYLK